MVMTEVESAMLCVVLGLTGIAMICGFIKMCKEDDPKPPEIPEPPPPDAFQILRDFQPQPATVHNCHPQDSRVPRRETAQRPTPVRQPSDDSMDPTSIQNLAAAAVIGYAASEVAESVMKPDPPEQQCQPGNGYSFYDGGGSSSCSDSGSSSSSSSDSGGSCGGGD